jgi:hypothetical protein
MKRVGWVGLLLLGAQLQAQNPWIVSSTPHGVPESPLPFAIVPGFPQEGATAMRWNPSSGPVSFWPLPVSFSHPDLLLHASTEVNGNLCLRYFLPQRKTVLKECFAFQNQRFQWHSAELTDASLPFNAAWFGAKTLQDKIKVLGDWSGTRPDTMVMTKVPELMQALVQLTKEQPASIYNPTVRQFFESPTGQEVLVWRKKEQAEEFFNAMGQGDVSLWTLLLEAYFNTLIAEGEKDLRILVASVLSRVKPEPQFLEALAIEYQEKNLPDLAEDWWKKYVLLMDELQRGKEVPPELRNRFKR